ncbi:MAG TPA: hypothetical protein VKB80_23670 [Kofleriaceae bacterium]|nr:hypothetical protein [Kofleriaceae bacterium]
MASAAAVAGPGTLARQASASSAASAAGSGGDSGELGGVGASAIERALELLAANLAAGGAEWLAPAAGPRVLLPAGLGGFVAGSAAARAVGLPAASAAGTARVWPAALTEPLGGGRPAALDHVLWADRWLARFAGASPAALRSFDAARAGSPGASSFESAFASPFAAPFASVGQLRTGEWSPAWVAPRADTPAAARLAAGGGVASSARSSMTAAVPARADASSPDAQAPEVRRAIIVDDDEPVADSVFSAIAAEAAAHRQRARGGARRADGPRAASVPSRPPVPAGPSVPAGPFRPPLADRALAGFPLGGSPGLAAGLAASPLASILAGLLELAPQPAFDPRTLSLTALGDFLARGAVAARALGGAGGGDDAAPASVAAALQRLAGSAPGWVWLSLADGGGSGGALAAARAGWSAAGHQGPGMSGGPGRAPGGESQGAIDMSAAAGLSGGPQGESTPTAAAATGPSGITGALGIAGPSGTAGALGIAGALASPGLRQGHAWPSLVGPAGEAAPWSEALGPSAPRPGDIGTRAESFADARTIAASDLALDFLAPEILAAARAAGMGPIEAGRAQRLAASGLPHLMALAMAVDRVFVHALSPGHAGAIDRAGAAGAAGAAAASAAAAAGSAAAASTGGPAGAASASAAAAAGGAWPLAATGGDSAGRTDAAPAALRAAAALERSAPARLPRGAFLLPGAAARALGVSAGAAESLRPNIAAALDLVAASHVAEAAAAASLPASAIDTADTGVATAASLSTLAAMAGAASGSASAAGQEPGAPGVPGVPDVIGERDAAAAWSVPAEAARAQLPHELWPVFDAVYLSLGESAETRPLAPSARAARALALASRSAAASVSSASARARAAAAWAVLPVILTGGAEPSTGAGAAGAGEPVSSRAASAARSSAVARAGDALGALVAPTILMADGRADREQAASGFTREGSPRGNVSSPARASDTPFIDTGAGPRAPITSSPQPASRAAAPAPAPGAALSAADMAWFQEAAKKYFDSAGPTTGGISLAEMTLVTSAPRTQIAASAKAADRGVVQASSTTPTGGEGNQPDGVPLPGRPDIDKIAQDVFEQICRMMAVARERSGDPWQR